MSRRLTFRPSRLRQHANMPRLQDMFQTFLRELRPEDLSGSQGSYQLRMEILRRVNLVIAPSKAFEIR